MQLIFITLLIAFSSAYDVSLFNDFTADVDIYDMGRMGRGKNAGSWHRTLSGKQEVFYFLAMQPWRHLVWTEYDTTAKEWYKFYINEDATNIPSVPTKTSKKLTIDSSNDYCRKEYTHPMATYDIDWTQIVEGSVLESTDINGVTCYRHPAKLPLANIWLPQQFTKAIDLKTTNPCRYDYIGGKSITFRSFNGFNSDFIKDDSNSKGVPTNGYLKNKTRCYINPTPNNVDTDLAIVLGISDKNVVQKINSELKVLKDFPNVQTKTLYYLSGDVVKSEEIVWDQLGSKSVTQGSVDAVINKAKNDLAAKVKEASKTKFRRGTLVILLDRALSTDFDAETDFDRNGITAHVIVYNPKKQQSISSMAQKLLSVGEQYYEFTSAGEVGSVANSLFVGVRANLTERCDRTKCNGFCDGRDRCTCPMCCENSCFFSYCDAKTGTCSPWPEAKPKEKISCPDDCVGKRECIDLKGCVYKSYNEGCAPKAKCMRTYCDSYNKCKQESACEKDTKPSYGNKCWSYKCDTDTGNCKRDKSGAECPKLNNLCQEHVCDENLKCTVQDKKCVKTSNVAEMACYKSQCNMATGQCEDMLSCQKYSTCGPDSGTYTCSCNADTGFNCQCTGTAGEGSCDIATEICDSTGEVPECKVSPCKQDLYVEGCLTKTCATIRENGKTRYEIQWIEKNCEDLIEFNYIKKNSAGTTTASPSTDAETLCKDKFEKYCEDGECLAKIKDNVDPKAGCGECYIEPNYKLNKNIKTYTIVYQETPKPVPLCESGKLSTNYEKYKDLFAKVDCDGQWTFKDVTLTDEQIFDYCSGCYPETTCNKAKDYIYYSYDKETATCKKHERVQPPKCSRCSSTNDKYIQECQGEKLDKTFQYKGEGPVFGYKIPKYCYNDQCIPDPYFKCMSSSSDEGIREIILALRACSVDGTVKGEYHYSELWDESLYFSKQKQSSKFMEQVDSEAYCIWYVEEKECHTCKLREPQSTPVKRAEASKEWTLVDECEEQTKLYEDKGLPFYYLCNVETNECEEYRHDIEESESASESKEPIKYAECTHSDCKRYYPVDETQCALLIDYCDEVRDSIQEKRDSYVPNENEVLNIECKVGPDCDEDTFDCGIDYQSINNTNCVEAYENYASHKVDFGCRKPSQNCDNDTLHCTFEEFESYEDDIDDYTYNLTKGSLCHIYECKEVPNKESNGFIHWWQLTEDSYNKLHTPAASDCHQAMCNTTSGEVYQEVLQCQVTESFPTLTEAQAQCFYCQCSFKTGQMVLTMFSDTEDQTYELDACGNCIVRDRKTGEQINEKVPCVLTAAVNLTGAIAGATVAASIVFGLVGAMLIVSIGAFQTYQLVTSAMKNVISTTLENPEFVAADNEATNALAE